MDGMSNDPDGPPLLWLACAFVVVTFFAGYGSQAWADQTFDK